MVCTPLFIETAPKPLSLSHIEVKGFIMNWGWGVRDVSNSSPRRSPPPSPSSPPFPLLIYPLHPPTLQSNGKITLGIGHSFQLLLPLFRPLVLWFCLSPLPRVSPLLLSQPHCSSETLPLGTFLCCKGLAPRISVSNLLPTDRYGHSAMKFCSHSYSHREKDTCERDP